MSGLSYTALNLLRGGYEGSDPDREAIYGMGLQTGKNALTTQQLKLARDKLALDLIKEGYSASTGTLQDITGYNITEPGGLSSPSDVRNVSNLANLINMRKFAGDQESLERHFNAGMGGAWSRYAGGIGGLIGQATSRRPRASMTLGDRARKSLSV